MQNNIIELLMMPGLGALCGAIPFEDVLRKSQAFEPLSKNQKIIINSLAFCIPIIAGLIGYGVFGTFSAIACLFFPAEYSHSSLEPDVPRNRLAPSPTPTRTGH
jgi:hypothetical protein